MEKVKLSQSDFEALETKDSDTAYLLYSTGKIYAGENQIKNTYSDVDSELVSIAITTPPTKTSYHLGEVLNLAGIVVTATYADGNTSNITSSCTFTPANGSTVNSLTFVDTVSYQHCYDKQSFTVLDISGITIQTEPTKKTYYSGEELDLDGLVVMGTYSDGQSIDVTSLCSSVPEEGTPITQSVSSVQIKYKTFSQSYNINVIKLFSIMITTQPKTTNFENGDTLDLTGIRITGTYTDEAQYDVTNICTFSPAIGTQLTTTDTSVTITCEDKTQGLSIQVSNLSSISVTNQPIKTAYIVGETLDLTGLVVTGHYSDDWDQDVTSRCTFAKMSGYVLARTDTSNIITYHGKTYTQPIYVRNIGEVGDFTYTQGTDPGVEGTDYVTLYTYNSLGDTCLALYTSGTLTLTYPATYDIFIAGGGGGGGQFGKWGSANGSPGGASSAGSYTANGGGAGNCSSGGGSGGSGGGGYNIAGASDGYSASGAGQGTTTRAFAESTGNLYCAGGGSIYINSSTSLSWPGGAGGGGGGNSSGTGGSGTAHSGSGGGAGGWHHGYNIGGGAGGGAGGYTTNIKGLMITEPMSIVIGNGGIGGNDASESAKGGSGANGIVLVRVHESAASPLPNFTYTGRSEWRDYKTNLGCSSSSPDAVLALLTSGTLTFEEDVNTQAFMVGGGGGGAGGHVASYGSTGGGGGGGYVATNNISFTANGSATITIGAGGSGTTANGAAGSATTLTIDSTTYAANGAGGGTCIVGSGPAPGGVGSTTGGQGGYNGPSTVGGSTSDNCAFGETDIGFRYAGGGGGAGMAGGNYGGGTGGDMSTAGDATANTGGGGGGNSSGGYGNFPGGNGGSGIILIRKI